MKKRGAAALLAAICLLAGCAASDPALPAETPTPTETSSPAYQGDSLFAYCTERQRELLELPHEELPVELIFHHWTETAADYETRDETVIAGVLQALRDVSVESESPIVSTDNRGLTFVTAQGDSVQLRVEPDEAPEEGHAPLLVVDGAKLCPLAPGESVFMQQSSQYLEIVRLPGQEPPQKKLFQ